MTESQLLLKTARDSIASAFDRKMPDVPRGPEDPRGVFVTLRKDGALRGCIGHLTGGTCSIRELVAYLARSSAFHDYRFPPLEKEELDQVKIEISILSEPKRIRSVSQFVPGRDGIIMSLDGKRAVFLPQVADETGWGRDEMLSNLSLKAGLAADAWRNPAAVFMTFQTEVISE